ncbi:helix-turn-helix transcriptional regulator [Streptomyces sp. NBC_01465]|uniref:helix-turn-helix transcriptional regulator n=1 Tax=Streptomyces sp. NBC_01465 TaxID=2903878 RepID=UPI002E2F9599|nr:LuxR C-terminal-related transcriptional regulator [Streptomyces sp. NBC_01465]
MAAIPLSAAVPVLEASLGDMLGRVSAAVAALVPHRAAAELSPHCTHTPIKSYGDTALTGRITGAELERIAEGATAGEPWEGMARIGGADRPVVVVLSDKTHKGATLVLVRDEDAAPVAAGLDDVQALWDLVTAHSERFTTEAIPVNMARSRATASERARIIAELGDAHAAALTGLLGVLRSRDLDDATARARATEYAVTALLEQRAEADRDKALSEEPADEAFERLADSLAPLLRHSPVRLELGPPVEERGRPVPANEAHALRAVVRAVVLSVMEQAPLQRIHVGWQVAGDELRATVRDDGPGELSYCSLSTHRVNERLGAVGGKVTIDAVPGWGTTVTAVVPLGTPAPAAVDPLGGLGSRELEVLGHLAQGHRNRAIAEDLHISESTVKFHVANILTKLGVGSRGEAAARFREAA